MARNGKKKTGFGLVLLLVLLCAAAGLVALVALRAGGGTAEAIAAPAEALLSVFAAPTPEPVTALEGFAPAEPTQPATEEGGALLRCWEQIRACESVGAPTCEGDSAGQTLRLTLPDWERLRADLLEALGGKLAEWVDEAAAAGEVYGGDGRVRPELLKEGFTALLPSLPAQGDYREERDFTLRLAYDGERWAVTNRDELDALWLGELRDADAAADRLLAALSQELPYIPKHYVLDEGLLAGPAPDPARFGESEDTAELEALLQTEEAQRLIAGRELVWNPEIERFPGSTVHWYLDETILCIVWQEVEAREVGTFSEIIVADGSQLRRRIAGDEPFSFAFETTTDFAHDCNAVLCLGGDFYHHGRACGVVVYQREILRFEPNTCDCCYITPDGDMLFSYRGQFSTQEEAESFIADNDVLWSLGFGPVLIDDGEDVTPTSYAWGEINDNYARSALGLIDPLHYLTMNLNCGRPGTQYYFLATLRQEADAMLARGCVKAYALDGGQTATTVFNGVRINPVQFGWEKPISDVIYFASALPETPGTGADAS